MRRRHAWCRPPALLRLPSAAALNRLWRATTALLVLHECCCSSGWTAQTRPSLLPYLLVAAVCVVAHLRLPFFLPLLCRAAPSTAARIHTQPLCSTLLRATD